MALTQDQKLACYQLCQAAVPMMSSAEYLRAVTVQGIAYGAATDPAAVSPTIITEIQSFRAANGSPTITVGSGFYVDPGPAQRMAKLSVIPL
jgi:hypothetical protein